MNQQESANTHDIRVNINERTNFSVLLFSMTTLIFGGAWILARIKTRDSQIELLIDQLGEISFGGRLANDSLGIYQHAHKSMIDANTNIVQRVPEQVRILAEEQRPPANDSAHSKAKSTTCSRILKACRTTWQPQRPSLWSMARSNPIEAQVLEGSPS